MEALWARRFDKSIYIRSVEMQREANHHRSWIQASLRIFVAHYYTHIVELMAAAITV